MGPHFLLPTLLLFFHSRIQKINGKLADHWAHYHNEDELETILININKRCPNYTTVYSIGQSVEGRHLLVIQFSKTPGEHQLCSLLLIHFFF